jgi:glutaminase
MYDFAGEWLFRVGLPAKSGVSGGISAVHPGRLGIGAHSPLLDPRGNSVRGIAACELLSERLGLHLFAGSPGGAAKGCRHATAEIVRSRRARLAVQRRLLDSDGGRIAVHTLSGVHDIASIERVVRDVVQGFADAGWHVFDLSRLASIEPGAVRLFAELITQRIGEGAEVIVVRPRVTGVRREVADVIAAATASESDPDTALQYCEQALLVRAGVDTRPRESLVPLAEQDLFEGLGEAAVAALEAATETRVYAAGSRVFDEGAPADGIYFIAAGQVSTMLKVGWANRRLSMMGPGSSFGELALLDGGVRSVAVVADEPTLCQVLTSEALEQVIATDPIAGVELYRAIARGIAVRLRHTTRELSLLDASY